MKLYGWQYTDNDDLDTDAGNYLFATIDEAKEDLNRYIKAAFPGADGEGIEWDTEVTGVFAGTDDVVIQTYNAPDDLISAIEKTMEGPPNWDMMLEVLKKYRK